MFYGDFKLFPFLKRAKSVGALSENPLFRQRDRGISKVKKHGILTLMPYMEAVGSSRKVLFGQRLPFSDAVPDLVVEDNDGNSVSESD